MRRLETHAVIPGEELFNKILLFAYLQKSFITPNIKLVSLV